MITIAVDARPLLKRHDGISRYLWELIEHLGQEPDLRLVLISHKPLLPFSLPASAISVVDESWSRLPGTLWFATRFTSLARLAGADLVWGPQHVLPPWGKAAPQLVLTLHDLVFRRFPETMHWTNRWPSRLLLKRSLARATSILCISEFTRGELLELYPDVPADKIEVIHNGAVVLPPEELLEEALPGRFLFALGSVEPRKNLAQVLQVFSRLLVTQPDLHLVLAGGAQWGSERFWGLADELGVRDRVHFTGRVTDGQIRYCLARCAAFVFASSYEGFGLPALEASGIAPLVIMNDIPVFHEIARYVRGAMFVSFADAAQAAVQIDQALRSCTIDCGAVDGPTRDWAQVAKAYAAHFRMRWSASS